MQPSAHCFRWIFEGVEVDCSVSEFFSCLAFPRPTCLETKCIPLPKGPVVHTQTINSVSQLHQPDSRKLILALATKLVPRAPVSFAQPPDGEDVGGEQG